MLPEDFAAQLRPWREVKHELFPDLLDYGVQNGETYAVFPYRQDDALFEPSRSRAELVSIAAQLLEGLHQSWEHGLDPGAIPGHRIRVSGGSARLDFHWQRPDDGRCRPLEIETAVAPERMTGGGQPASTQFELGLVLFQALTGRRAFGESDDPLQQILCSLQEEPHALELDNPALEAVVLRLLERDPTDRFPDLPAAAAALLSCA